MPRNSVAESLPRNRAQPSHGGRALSFDAGRASLSTRAVIYESRPLGNPARTMDARHAKVRKSLKSRIWRAVCAVGSNWLRYDRAKCGEDPGPRDHFIDSY